MIVKVCDHDYHAFEVIRLAGFVLPHFPFRKVVWKTSTLTPCVLICDPKYWT